MSPLRYLTVAFKIDLIPEQQHLQEILAQMSQSYHFLLALKSINRACMQSCLS